MRVLCGIRTNVWNENAVRLCEQLQSYFGGKVVVIFHNRNRNWRPPVYFADINGRWAKRMGLGTPSDWGWRCGDYFYYRMRQNWPDYDQYWLLEPDVFFAGDPGAFFSKFEDVQADMLTYKLMQVDPKSVRFARQMPAIELRRAIFALTRFSGRAIDYLFEERKVYSKHVKASRMFANDEIFSMSHVHANDELTDDAFEKIAPEWFANSFFNTAPDILADELRTRDDIAPGLYHPVHEKPQFKDAIAKRVVGSGGFISRMSRSTRHLDEADVEDILASVSQGLRRYLPSAAAPVDAPAGANEETEVEADTAP